MIDRVLVDLGNYGNYGPQAGITFECKYPYGGWFDSTEDFVNLLTENSESMADNVDLYIRNISAYNLAECDGCIKWIKELHKEFEKFKETL